MYARIIKYTAVQLVFERVRTGGARNFGQEFAPGSYGWTEPGFKRYPPAGSSSR